MKVGRGRRVQQVPLYLKERGRNDKRERERGREKIRERERENVL